MDFSTWSVLLVDDEEEFVTTLAERLSLRGVKTRTALDGESALRELAAEQPQVAVVDVMMPGMRGLDLLQRIRRDYPSVKVILLTGQGSTKDGIDGMRYGAFDYMTKPLDFESLVSKLAEAVGSEGAS